jgi:hypothetical protein
MGIFVYAGLYLLALAPGLPVGFVLFGRRHAAGWVVGAALGYFFTAIALWAVIASGHPSAIAFVLAWAAVTAIAWAAVRPATAPIVAVPAWTRRDTAALLVTLLLVPAIVGPPFAKLGATDADGNRYYRAYFTADFVWHMAVTAEIKKFAMPPRNMFMPHRPLHYYWAYFLLPGSAAGAGPRALANVETDLVANAIGTAFLLTASIFIVAWMAIPRAWPVAAAVALAVTASSAEGLVAVISILRRGGPMMPALRDLNIDAISNWWFGGLRVDGLVRCFWWVPQHSMAYVLGLGALSIAASAGSAAPLAACAIAGLCLAGSIAFNPFVGALFAVAWGAAALIDAVRSPEPLARIARCSTAAVPAAAGLAWCLVNQMTGGAHGMLQFGLLGNARHSPIFNLLLSLGPALILAGVGFVAACRLGRARSLTSAALLIVLSLCVMHLVVLTGDLSWVGFRAGQLVLITVPGLIAAGLSGAGAWKRVAIVAVVAAVCLGLPTTIVDVYNAQDIGNLSEGPGFPWTQVVDRQQAAALDWLRRATRATDTVQLDAIARDETTWSIIPSFAERRQAAGTPRTLVEDPEYQERSERVRTMYATGSAREAWEIARALRVDYVWIDEVERAAYASGMAKFETSPQYFVPAFRNARVAIYRVK